MNGILKFIFYLLKNNFENNFIMKNKNTSFKNLIKIHFK